MQVMGAVATAATVLLLGAGSVSAEPQRPLPGVPRAWSAGEPGYVALREAIAAKRAQACGTTAASPTDVEALRAALRRWADENAAGPPGGTIRVAVHVITSNGEGDVTDARIADQVRELNRSFEGTGYRFELSRVDRTEEPEWFRMTPGSAPERQAKQALATEPARHLNLYVCGAGPGWASYPWAAPEGHFIHGVVVDHAVLPDGPIRSAPSGAASHQVGHYLGLVDPDDPGTGFSADQVGRMRAVVPLYRPSLFTAPVSPGRPGSEIAPAEGAEPEDGRVLSYRGAFPNPFHTETALRFTLPTSQPVSLRIYSVAGQLVRTLVDATLPPGDHSAMFRADDLPSGAYFAVLKAGRVQMSRTLMLVR